jgi:raffinose/stachyose/melibiose transport system substrate-binding protein
MWGRMISKMTKKIAIFLFGALLIMAVLSGCRQIINQNHTEASTVSDGQHEPITITSYGNFVSDAFIDALHEVYPEINLERSYYCGTNEDGYARYSFEQDDMTDIYVGTSFLDEEMQPERLVDLSAYSFVNAYSTSMLNAVDLDGSIYMLPSGYHVIGIYYNKTIMEENGWHVPDSLNEMAELLPEIEAAGYIPVTCDLSSEDSAFNYFFGFGNTVWFNSQEGIRWKKAFAEGEDRAMGRGGFLVATTYFKNCMDIGLISKESTDPDDFLKNGRSVFYLTLDMQSFETTAEDGTEYEFGMIPWLSQDGSNNMLLRSVCKYYGINKHLEEAGNEQKLEDALHVMEFLSSAKGVEMIMGEDNVYDSPLDTTVFSKDHPYYEVQEEISSGRIVPVIDLGWEDLILPLSQDVMQCIEGDLTPEELAGAFDATYQSVINQTMVYYGTAKEVISLEDTMKLVGIAEAKAVDADCAIVSVNGSYGMHKNNDRGVGGKLYAGNIDVQKINVFRPCSDTISVLEMTGADIKELVEKGFDVNQDGSAFAYRLFVRNDSTLEDEKTYTLAVSTDELTGEYADKAVQTDISPLDAIAAYTTELGEFGSKDIIWN